MKKHWYVITVILVLMLSLAGLTACKETEEAPYTYEASSEYFNLAVSLTANGATTRAFSFFTANDESYLNACVVQLDPAETSETAPQFNTEDNFTLNAVSEMGNENFEEAHKAFFDMAKLYFQDRMSHHAFADKLSPGQKYFYRMGSESKDTWSEWGSFVTDNGDNSFSFMHITDSQADTKERFDAFGGSLKTAFEQTGTPEFVVITGDLVESGYEKNHWDMLFDSMKGTINTTSLVPVCGNHEKMAFILSYNFNLPMPTVYTYYAFEYGDALMVVMDTEDDISPQIMAIQAAWLESVLEASDKKWKIVSFHKSLFSSGGHAYASDTVRLREMYVPIFAKHNVDLVMSGHDHVYARTVPVNGLALPGGQEDYQEKVLSNGAIKHTYTNPDGVVYVINRTIGSKYYAGEGHNSDVVAKGDEGRATKPIFSKVDVTGDTLTYTAYEHNRETGEIDIWDAFTLFKPAA